MINLVSNKLIYRPITEIFNFISTPENDFQWQYGILASAQISDGACPGRGFLPKHRSFHGTPDREHLRGYRI